MTPHLPPSLPTSADVTICFICVCSCEGHRPRRCDLRSGGPQVGHEGRLLEGVIGYGTMGGKRSGLDSEQWSSGN